jgi:dolichol-phosphate mannosyltransferase
MILKLSAVIPVYNSGKIILGTYNSIKKEFEKITDDYEILFRNDGSTDNSEEVLKKIAKNDKKVHFFSNSNCGLGYVLRKLFKSAKGDCIIYFDADVYLSFDLTILPNLLKKMDDADVVITSRYQKGKVPFSRLTPSLVYRAVNRLLFGIYILDVGSGFVFFKRKVLDAIELSSNGFDIHIELFTKIKKNGFKVIEMPVEYSHWEGGTFKVFKHGPKTLIETFKLWWRGL